MTKPAVFVHDDLHPEDNAMLQALYSRSPESVVNHLEKVRKSGSGKFMDSYYVGYGHASIGDCGSTTVFIENVSMLAAKAIQDNPLYSGQEASTRYLDFSKQPLINPLDTPESHAIQQRWIDLYNEYMPLMKEAIAAEHPFNPNEYKSEGVWAKAVAARAFDTLRSLIPLGCATLLSWTTNLRQARDHLMRIRTHPLAEVQEMAIATFNQLYEKYPHSFNGREMELEDSRYNTRHAYESEHGARDHHQSWGEIISRYQLSDAEQNSIRQNNVITRTRHLDIEGILREESAALTKRPQGASLPQRLKQYGTVEMVFQLDYGAFKDLQRHRGGLSMSRVPLIDNTFGFHAWFLGEFARLLPDGGHELITAIHQQLEAIQSLWDQGCNPYQLQYLYPHGVSSAHTITYSLPQLMYVAELRSMKTVHPSLRPTAQYMAQWMQETFPGIALYADMEPDGWTAKRGDQDILAKAA